MIAFLRGTVAGRGPGWAEVDVGGIGFRLALSTHAASALPPPGGQATLPTQLVLREDGAALYGFRDQEERAAFAALTAVASIGPKTALAILSSFTPEALARAVDGEDVAALCRVSGVGRKTAQRLVLELRGQLDAGAGPATAAPPADGPEAEARAALVALGYGAAEAAAAVAKVRGEGADTGALVRAALRGMGIAR